MALVNTYYELCDHDGEDDKILLRGIQNTRSFFAYASNLPQYVFFNI
jgi:hypothetical protein